MNLKKLKKIDVKYYRTVLETQNNPEILKAELEDLVNEVWAAQKKIKVAKPSTSDNKALDKIADEIESECFPGGGKYIDPKASSVLRWYQQLRKA